MKQKKNIWEQSRVELFQKLDCRETGLSQEDAADRLAKYGANELHAGKQKSVLQIFLGQFADFLVLILILAAVISACMGDVESMIVILAVITMNAILGTVQTVKLRIAGQPEADVRSHRQGAAGRSDRTDPWSRGGSR